MNEFRFLVLKARLTGLVGQGRYILAQGKRPDSYRESAALGWRKNIRFVRGKKPANELSSIRTK